jgi:hypothetical protein
LKQRQRFKDIWLTEPDFMLNLVEEGYSGMAAPDANVGHRVQPALFERSAALDRARKTGACSARVRLEPFRKSVKQALMFHEHPWLARLFISLKYLRWQILRLASYFYATDASRFEHRLIAIEGSATAREYLRAANLIDQYSIVRRVRTRQAQV